MDLCPGLFLLLAFVLAGPWRRSRVLTDADLAEFRSGGRGAQALRVLKVVCVGTLMNVAALATVLVAAVRIAEMCLPWHAWLPALVFGAEVQLVSSLGISARSDIALARTAP